jgi:hypothetical protein
MPGMVTDAALNISVKIELESLLLLLGLDESSATVQLV